MSHVNPDTGSTTNPPRPHPPRQRPDQGPDTAPPGTDTTVPVAHPQTSPRDAPTSTHTPDTDTATRQTIGTTALAHHLTDPDTEMAVQALAAQAPTMTEDQRAHLARLLHLRPHRTGYLPAPRPPDTPPGA